MKIFAIIFGLFWTFYPTVAVFASEGDCFDASGFSESNYNGSYVQEGTYLGYPRYVNTDSLSSWGYSGGGDGRIFLFAADTPTGVPGVNDHYYNDTVGGVLAGGSYSVGTAGSGSGGSISEVDCPSSPVPESPFGTFVGGVTLNQDVLIMFAFAPLIAMAIYFLLKMFGLFKW